MSTSKTNATTRKSKKEVQVQGPRAYTEDEVIEMLMDKLRSIADYWAKTNLDDWRKPLPDMIPKEEVFRRCHGVVFTFLSSGLDGAGDLPGIDLVLCPHENDQEYRRDRGENWFQPEMRISTTLHDFYHE